MLLVAVSSALKIGHRRPPMAPWYRVVSGFHQAPIASPMFIWSKDLGHMPRCQTATFVSWVFHSGDHIWMVYFMENPMNLWMV